MVLGGILTFCVGSFVFRLEMVCFPGHAIRNVAMPCLVTCRYPVTAEGSFENFEKTWWKWLLSLWMMLLG